MNRRAARRLGLISTFSFLLSVMVVAPVLALGYSQNIGVNFTFNSSIVLDLTSSDIVISSLAPNTAADSNIVNINVLTNSANGYTLNATVGNNTTYNTRDLIHSDTTQTAKFSSVDYSATPTITANSSLDPNTWAYSYSTDNGTTWANYNGLPLWSDNEHIATLKDSNAPVANTTGDAIKFKIAAKADASQSAGTYNNVINFTLVAKPVPVTLAMAYESAGKETINGYYKMQDMTASICNAVEVEGEPLQVIDIRDGSVYTIDKLAGACWMTQNLRITGDIAAADSNFHTNSTFNPCVGDLTAGNSYDEARCHDSGNTETGVWYNYASASAGTITGSSNNTPATEDICPAGWHLPSYDETKPAGSINSLIDLPDKDYFSPVTGGGYYGGSILFDGNGYWWSSVALNSLSRYRLYYDGSSLSTSNGSQVSRYHGFYIRCVNDNSTSSKLYMQDQTQSSLATLMPNVGDEVTLYDSRDEKSYTVAKLADGNYWMTANLNLAGGTALSADDTDVDASYISSFTTSNNLTKSNNTIVLPASSQSGFNTVDSSYVYNSPSTDCSSSTGCYGYYSWDAATLGSGRSISADNTNASYSICPKGWKLPTTYNGSGSAAEATDFRALMIALGGSNSVQTYNSSTTPTGATMYGKLVAAPYNYLLAGCYSYGSFSDGGSYGYYWSATSYPSSSFARYLYFYSTGVYSAGGNTRNFGVSVRCVFGD